MSRYLDNHHNARQLSPNNDKGMYGWSKLSDGITWTWESYATSYYSRQNRVLKRPNDLKGFDFNFDIPEDATVVSCKFFLRIRINKKLNIPVPSIRFNFVPPKSNGLNNTKSFHQTGWHNGYYVDAEPVQGNKLGTNFGLYEYEFPVNELKKGGYDYNTFNDSSMNVVIQFRNAQVGGSENYSTQVQFGYCYLQLAYVLPNHQIRFVEISDTSNLKTGDTYYIDAIYTQTEKEAIHGGNVTFNTDLSWGTEILSYGSDTSTYANNSWTVNSVGLQEHKLHLGMKSHVIGYNELMFVESSTPSKCSFIHQISLGYGVEDGYDNILLSFDGAVRQYGKGCMYVSIEGYSTDATASYTLSSNKEFRALGWEIVDEIRDVSINSVSADNTTVTLNVRPQERFKAYLKVCFVPYGKTNSTFTITSSDTGQEKSITINVGLPVEFHVSSEIKEDTYDKRYFYFSTDKLHLMTHRPTTDVETGTTILDLKSDDNDAVMYQSSCNLTLDKWEDLDYIGCVPLEHLHFDPKSTYKDSLLNTTYKNKRYMGKKLAVDEDITLNVRLHPHQVTTIQGLIDMDKPIPINANHKCFEGDALNHRGWAEIYSVKADKTNEHWYKCDIDVKYLTHNLNSRFNIFRGNKICNYPLSDVMQKKFESGDSLSTDEENYFIVSTDGTYHFNDLGVDENLNKINPSMWNVFNINNGQHFTIQSKETLSNVSRIAFEWNSALFDELKENNISRIIRLKDRDGNSVFEYEYTDLDFHKNSDNSINNISVNIVYRVRTLTGWENVNKEITLRTEIDNDNTEVDESTTVVSDSEEVTLISNSSMLYGSTLHLELNNNKLKILDEGFNGRELFTENAIDLVGEEYYWETTFTNRNSDDETNTCTTYVDFIVDETLFARDLATKYSKCIVSPFPVPKKKLLFTREGDEGTMYFYEDDGEEFSYLIEPYYQYLNGCDLIDGGSGSSIFNLNYGYEIVYIQNGLVRLGFNRSNAQMYLGKYDPSRHSYITTQVLSLEKYSDVNIKSISDDKIEIQASDIIFTIWRGHPYIMINHPTEDIIIESWFDSVWAEGVGSASPSESPSLWLLRNNSNLLPSEVGGHNEIKPSSVEVSEKNISRTASTMSWNNLDPNTGTFDVQVDVAKSFIVSGSIQNPSCSFDIDGSNCDFGQYTVSTEVSHRPYGLTVWSQNPVIKSTDTTEFMAKLVDYNNQPINNSYVYFYEVYEPNPTLESTRSIIQNGETVDLTATLRDTSDGSLVKDAIVHFYKRED